MDESLTERRRVGEEGLTVVKPFGGRGISTRGNAGAMTVVPQQAPANYVPAAAVTRMGRALFGIIGRKGHAGGMASPM